MRPIKSKIVRGLPIGAYINVVDNSGARIGKLISVKNYKARTKKLACAGIGDMVTITVKAGNPDMMHKVVQGVIIRQKQPWARPDGTRVKFEDNAMVILKDLRLGLPKGTIIKGPMAKEAALRWSQVAKIANIVL